MPALDYSRRETIAYIKEPTQQDLDALRAKKKEARAGWLYASPFGPAAILLAVPLFLTTRRPLNPLHAICELLHDEKRADGEDVGAGTIKTTHGGARVGH